MKSVLKIIAVAISFAAASCADANKTSPDGIRTTVIDQAVLDSATVLVVDSTDQRFAPITDANTMLVYKDSLLIVSHSEQAYGEPIISLYDRGNPLRRLGNRRQTESHQACLDGRGAKEEGVANYIPRGSDTDEMVACRIHIAGDKLFVSDCYYTGRYCTIPLRQPLPPADELRLSFSGVEERGVAIAPFRDGLLVENPQCFSDDEAGIHNDVPRLLHFRNGRCLNPHEPVTYQVADVNTGADIHYNESCERICFVSHRQPLVEFYDDSLHLVHSLTFQSDDLQKIHIGKPQTTMHQRHSRGETGRGISATFDQTQRVVGAGSQLHAFLCSAANDKHIYLVYCGKLFGYDYHTFPSYILVLDWDGNLVDTYRYDRWIQAISPSTSDEKGAFYLTVYADDDCNSARMKLVKVIPQLSEETDSLAYENKDTVR